MKKLFIFFLILTLAGVAFATPSRIEGMGKTDRYMLDEMAMFTNPASFMLYPNTLTGSLGKYKADYWPYNLSEQWFGGWLTVNNVVFGGAFNRHDDLENYLVARRYLNYKQKLSSRMYILYDVNTWTKDTVAASDTGNARYDVNGNRWIVDSLDDIMVETTIPKPIGETDVFLGYNMGNMGIGVHLFIAQQESLHNEIRETESGVVRGDLGFIMKLNDKDLVDLSLTLARITYYSKIASDMGVPNLEEATYSLGANARAYLTVASLGGQLIPSFKYSQKVIANDTALYVSPGLGYQREIEGGIFWTGVDYGYSLYRDAEGGVVDTTITNSATMSFGIEKQVAWPWFILRVGGRKTISGVDVRHGNAEMESKSTNSDNDGSLEDAVGAGFSFKVGENLRFDVSANERLPYSNIFNGTLENIATRIGAVYKF